MLGFIIIMAIVGLVVGAIARLLLPGRDPIGILGTIIVGILGSFIGGFLESFVQYHTLSIHQFHPSGFIASIVGAFLLLLLLRLTHTEPGRRRRYRRR
jgi:uncharacterized membrane protein YeaQ/YmgE (transglycosylase-associated protein family)